MEDRVAEAGSEGENCHKNFCQAGIYFFRVVFACNCKFSNLTQYNVQDKPCNDAFLTLKETLLLTQKGTFLPKDFKKRRTSR